VSTKEERGEADIRTNVNHDRVSWQLPSGWQIAVPLKHLRQAQTQTDRQRDTEFTGKRYFKKTERQRNVSNDG
jgi:hypothetical protein